jgi:hypothetical protein
VANAMNDQEEEEESLFKADQEEEEGLFEANAVN